MKLEYIEEVVEDYKTFRMLPKKPFMVSILTNDLRGAVNKIDFHYADKLTQIVNYMKRELRDDSWGSNEAVENWIKGITK